MKYLQNQLLVRKIITRVFKLLICKTFILVAAASAEPSFVTPETKYNFNSVRQGQLVEHGFLLKNEGDSPLTIEQIHSSCGCLATIVDTKSIPAQESTLLKVTFDTTGFAGQKTKSVRVYTNDTKHSSELFIISGRVEQEVVVLPEKIIFEPLRQGEEKSTNFQVSLAPQTTAKILDIYTKSDVITVQVEKTSENQTTKNGVVTIKPQFKAGNIRDKFFIKTSLPNNQTIAVPVFAEIAADVTVEPSVVSFGLIQTSQLLAKNKNLPSAIVTVKSNPTAKTPEKIIVLNVSSDFAGIRPEIVGTSDNGETRIKVNIREEITGIFRANLTIETNSKNEDEREISVPVYGMIDKNE